MEESKEFKEKVSSNTWHKNFDEVVVFIKQATNEEPYESDGNTLKPGCVDWRWARNMECKYISLRIDMRDGGFILCDKSGNRISLDRLKWQYRSKDEV